MILLAEDFSMLFMLLSGGFRGFNFLSLLNHCNECSVTRAIVVVVMLTGYLPEMQSKHLIKLIMMIGIVNFSSEFTARFLNRFGLTSLTIQPVELTQELISNDPFCQ